MILTNWFHISNCAHKFHLEIQLIDTLQIGFTFVSDSLHSSCVPCKGERDSLSIATMCRDNIDGNDSRMEDTQLQHASDQSPIQGVIAAIHSHTFRIEPGLLLSAHFYRMDGCQNIANSSQILFMRNISSEYL